METLIFIVTASFLIGILCCHFFWRWYQSAKIIDETKRLNSEHVDAEFDMRSGVTYYRPYRLGGGQDRNKENCSGLSKIYIIKHSSYLEIFGAWANNNSIQIDPYPLYLPTGNVDPDNLIKFGKYFVQLGEKLNKEHENV